MLTSFLSQIAEKRIENKIFLILKLYKNVELFWTEFTIDTFILLCKFINNMNNLLSRHYHQNYLIYLHLNLPLLKKSVLEMLLPLGGLSCPTHNECKVPGVDGFQDWYDILADQKCGFVHYRNSNPVWNRVLSREICPWNVMWVLPLKEPPL